MEVLGIRIHSLIHYDLNLVLIMVNGISAEVCHRWQSSISNSVSVHEASLQEQKLRGELRKQNIPANSLSTVSNETKPLKTA